MLHGFTTIDFIIFLILHMSGMKTLSFRYLGKEKECHACVHFISKLYHPFTIQCNDIDFQDITREEAVLILLALPDDVSLIVESKKESK